MLIRRCVQVDIKDMRATSSLPAVRCQDYLEAVEDRYRRSIPTDYDMATKCSHDNRLPYSFVVSGSTVL